MCTIDEVGEGEKTRKYSDENTYQLTLLVEEIRAGLKS